jgi:hypothetical protein
MTVHELIVVLDGARIRVQSDGDHDRPIGISSEDENINEDEAPIVWLDRDDTIQLREFIDRQLRATETKETR